MPMAGNTADEYSHCRQDYRSGCRQALKAPPGG
jgi:hypothetical protein